MKKNRETIFNVVVGTAGHIDHGKSSLVQRLSGIDPDRLPEEKERGLTIDLGFAPLELESGLRVGIIDVPGHERLVKNMVAGATGIDLVILVVAADDGVMPQTEEHVAIMDLLGIEHGIVAITKIDIVEEDLRELVREDIRESLGETFLRDAPIVEVSSTTGEGIPELLRLLHEQLASVRPRDESGIFRLPIQRIFSAKGFGTVVTGVPVSGSTKIGDTLEIVPLAAKGRVRGIHAYKEATDFARAGHSSAINLTDIDYRRVERGMVLTEPGYLKGATMFEARLRYLSGNRKPLLHQAPVRLHTGTAEALGRVYLLERKTVEPGEETFVQFRLDAPLVAAPGDRFVLRSYSPAWTIGGGELLDTSRWRLKTGKEYVIDELRARATTVGDPTQLVVSTLERAGFETLSSKELALRVCLPPEECQAIVEQLLAGGAVKQASRGRQLVSTAKLEEARASVGDIAEKHFAKQPRSRTMSKLDLRHELRASDSFLAELVGAMAESGEIEERAAGKLAFRDFGPRLTDRDEEIRATILAETREKLFSPPSAAELAAERGWDPKVAQELAALLEDDGDLVSIGGGIVLHRDAIATAKDRLRAHIEAAGAVTASDAKELLGSTRKYVIPLLEHLDQTGFTLRQGDRRVLRNTGS